MLFSLRCHYKNPGISRSIRADRERTDCRGWKVVFLVFCLMKDILLGHLPPLHRLGIAEKERINHFHTDSLPNVCGAVRRATTLMMTKAAQETQPD